MERYDINAVLLAIYLWMFIVLRVIWAFNETYSTVILGSLAVLIILISIIKTKDFINRTFLKSIILILIIVALIIFSFFRSFNAIAFTRLYEFIIYGAIPIIIFSQIRNFEAFLKTYVKLAFLVFVLYIFDPINDYFISGTYMVFGYQAMLPAFFGLHIGRIKYNIRWFLLLEIIAFISLIVFANRMASIAAIFYILVINLFYTKITTKKIILYFIGVVVSITILINLNSILEYIVFFIDSLGYNSYSLTSILLFIEGDSITLDAGRGLIWEAAINLIKQKPIVGYGIGYFETINGLYSHNLLIDAILQFGIFGLLTIIILIINSIYKMKYSNKNIQLVGIILFCTSFPKLFTSIYFFIEPTFWLLILFGITISKLSKIDKEGHIYEKKY